MDLSFVTLPSIDLGDGAFEIGQFSCPARLGESLARFGIIDPPWLRKKGAGHIVVDGFKRLRWAAENGEGGAVCRIFDEDFDDRRLWTLRIEKKILELDGKIDPAQKARIISVLAGLFDEIPAFFLSDLRVSNRPDLLRKWMLLAADGPQTLEILASGAVTEHVALETAGWDKSGRDCILGVLSTLKCSASIQAEIVERVSDIASRDGKVCADVIGSAGGILSAKGLDRRQKTQALRDYLARLRNPRLSLRQERFRRDVEALGLPPGVRVVPPAAFEGGGWKMELSFTGPDELRKILGSTRSAAESDRLEALLRPAAGRYGG